MPAKQAPNRKQGLRGIKKNRANTCIWTIVLIGRMHPGCRVGMLLADLLFSTYGLLRHALCAEDGAAVSWDPIRTLKTLQGDRVEKSIFAGSCVLAVAQRGFRNGNEAEMERRLGQPHRTA